MGLILETPTQPRLAASPGPRIGTLLVRGARLVWQGITGLFGLGVLILGLAVLAAIPLLQFVSLGYLLEASGRVARSGRIRDAAPGLDNAKRLGGALLGWGFLLLPVWILNVMANDARLIDSASASTANLGRASLVLVIAVSLQGVLATLRGARFSDFFRPIANLRWLWRTRNQPGSPISFRGLADCVRQVRPVHYSWLGFRGFAGAFLWLLIPSVLLAAGPKLPLIGWLGGIALVVVVQSVPFLQAQFAAQNQFSAFRQWRAVREKYRRAPLAFLVVFWVTILLTLPLYVLKVEVIPRDALWLPAIFFLLTIYPAKVLAGWALAIADRQPNRAHWLWRYGCRLLMLPVAGLYAIFVFFSQYTGWHGVVSLFEHHAFLVPVPF